MNRRIAALQAVALPLGYAAPNRQLSKYKVSGGQSQPSPSLASKVKAEIQKIKADTAGVYIQAGAVTPAEVRAVLVLDPDSGYDNLDLDETGGPAEMETELAKIFGPEA